MQTNPVNNSSQSAHHKNKQAPELELRLMHSMLTHLVKNRREDTEKEGQKIEKEETIHRNACKR